MFMLTAESTMCVFPCLVQICKIIRSSICWNTFSETFYTISKQEGTNGWLASCTGEFTQLFNFGSRFLEIYFLWVSRLCTAQPHLCPNTGRADLCDPCIISLRRRAVLGLIVLLTRVSGTISIQGASFQYKGHHLIVVVSYSSIKYIYRYTNRSLSLLKSVHKLHFTFTNYILQIVSQTKK